MRVRRLCVCMHGNFDVHASAGEGQRGVRRCRRAAWGPHLGGEQDVAQVGPGAVGAAPLAQPAQVDGLVQAAQVAVLQAVHRCTQVLVVWR